MEGARRVARRWLTATAAAAAVGLLAALGAAAPAWAARVDPPDVTGLSLPAAQEALQLWDKSVLLIVVPELKEIPSGMDQGNLLIVSSKWLNPDPIDAVRPEVQLNLGTRMPDLTGLSFAAASTILTRHGLILATIPARPGPDLVAQSQTPEVALLIGVRSQVQVVFGQPSPTAPTTSTPSPVPPVVRPWSPGLVATVATAAGAGVALLALLGLLALRRAARWRRRGHDQDVSEQIDVRTYAGQVVGPDLVEGAPR
jgi:hypothetical protein